MNPKTCLTPGLAIALTVLARGETITLTTGDLVNTSSFNSALHWSNGAAPSAGNDYVVNIPRLRTPTTTGAYTFGGSSLTIGTSTGTLSYKTVGSNVITINNLILAGGLIDHLQGSVETFTLAGTMSVTGTGSRISATQGPVNITAPISGSGDLIFNGGSATFRTTISGTNTYTGNITVNGLITAAAGSSLKFAIGASGVNNTISGPGTAAFNGEFNIDLSGASSTAGDSWTLVNAATLTESFGATFTIPGFIESNNVWFSQTGNYVFSEATGVLSVIAADGDADGLPDSWELTHFGNLNQTGTGDPDNDYATNTSEYAAATSPADRNLFPDTEDGTGDGMSDAWEIVYFGTTSVLPGNDADSDTFTNLDEFLANSHPADINWTPVKARLRNRWSFNGSLADSVGTSAAQVIDPDNDALVGGTSTLSATNLLLGGGARATSAYAQLGTNLLQGLKTPVTIELWATQEGVQNWSRIFDFGSGTTEYLMMTWTQGTNVATDTVEWVDSETKGAANTNQPYTAGSEFHIVMTIEPGAGTNSSTLVSWYSMPSGNSDLGVLQGNFSTSNQLADFNDAVNLLGRSQWAGDNTANARYNEVRIWNGALTSEEREFLHDAGAEVVNANDSDGDGLLDEWEVENFRASPGESVATILAKYTATDDPDGDYYDNGSEFLDGTGPLDILSSFDSDADGLPDGWEVFWFGEPEDEDLFTIIGRFAGTDDNDSDGFNNGAEQTAGSNPENASLTPIDTDGDSLIDTWEQFYFSDLDEVAGGDPDGDSGNNAAEQAAGSNPTLTASTPTDIDGDSVPDTSEDFQPYTTDSSTLHLWHLDEIAAPATDAAAGGTSLTSLANGALMWSTSLAGFGTGLNPSAGRGTASGGVLSGLPLAADATDNVTLAYAGADGAFTFEAIVRLDFDPTVAPASVVPMQIITAEGDVAAERVWQFRMIPIGATGNTTGSAPLLEFINLRGEAAVQSLSAPLPVGAATNAAVQGGWYHVAVAYNGTEATADNLKFYWTLLDPSRTQASQLASLQMTNDLLASAACDFTIGNEGRTNGGSTDAFLGVIDEVRISSVARSSFQFLFTGGDGDSLADEWELQYFGNLDQTPTGDFDSDGTDNLTEYRLGLIPNNGSSLFQATRASNGQIQWPSVTGVTFTVRRSTDLSSWSPVATVPGMAGTANYTDPSPPAGKAFYQIVLQD
jgi:fibronectin-binding autotransporter adhesin